MAWGGDDDRDDVRDDDRDDAANDKSSHSPAFVSSSPRASRVASRVLRPAPAPQGFPGCAPSRWCFIRACRVARARTLRAFCRTMTTYLCTNPLATSARAVLSSSVAADDFAPSKVTASIAAARGTTGATRALAPRLPAIGRGDVIAVVPWSAALERMVKPCIASHESESRSDDARRGGGVGA